jgi:hypothetical protein
MEFLVRTGASKPALVTAHDLAVQRRCVHKICSGNGFRRTISNDIQVSASKEYKRARIKRRMRIALSLQALDAGVL